MKSAKQNKMHLIKNSMSISSFFGLTVSLKPFPVNNSDKIDFFLKMNF